jgi:hypothetical protein
MQPSPIEIIIMCISAAVAIVVMALFLYMTWRDWSWWNRFREQKLNGLRILDEHNEQLLEDVRRQAAIDPVTPSRSLVVRSVIIRLSLYASRIALTSHRPKCWYSNQIKTAENHPSPQPKKTQNSSREKCGRAAAQPSKKARLAATQMATAPSSVFTCSGFEFCNIKETSKK